MTQAANLVVRPQSQLGRIQPLSDSAQPQLRFQQRNSRLKRFQLECQLPGNMLPRLGRFLDILA